MIVDKYKMHFKEINTKTATIFFRLFNQSKKKKKKKK